MSKSTNTWRTAAAVAVLALAGTAHADPRVSVQFSIGAPPPVAPIYVTPGYGPEAVVAPSMVWMPEFGAYIALGARQPVFYLGGVYYYTYGGVWYRGAGYRGPWRAVGGPPPALRRFRDRDWGHYQNLARQRRGDSHWRQFRGDQREFRHDERRGPGEFRGPAQDRGGDRRDQGGPGHDRGGDRRDQGGPGRDHGGDHGGDGHREGQH